MNNVFMRRTRSSRVMATATAGALALVLTGCGSDDSTETVNSAHQSEVQPEEQPNTGEPTQSGSPDPDAGDLEGQIATLISAGRAAEESVPGSSVIHIELEDGGEWEVDVATADGTEHEVRVSSDGSQVVDGPREADTDQDDKRENSAALDRAELDFEKAVEALVAEMGDVQIEEISLDLDDDSVQWEIELIGDGDDYDVDAVSGAVVRS